MSQLLINDYLGQLDLIKKISSSQRETIVREAFEDLLKAWGRLQGLVLLAEYPFKTATQTNISVDGALLHELRMPLGCWEGIVTLAMPGRVLSRQNRHLHKSPSWLFRIEIEHVRKFTWRRACVH